MKNKIILLFIIFLIFTCKINIFAKKDLIKELKGIKKEFSIILWEKQIDPNINPVGFIFKDKNNELLSDTGMGFSSCVIIEMKQIKKNTIFIKIKSKSCIEFADSDEDAPPACKKWKILIIEYEITDKQIEELKKDKVNKIDIVGKVVQEEII
ncbi:MAG: hypothetical protein JXA68_11260 [Ignavibacteriales bacterium]|nr:hypothetical protein [Ignavibacteriales bacterium]